jgi:putative membrane protein
MKRILQSLTAAAGVCALLGSTAAAGQYQSGSPSQSPPGPEAQPPEPSTEPGQEASEPSRAVKSFIEDAAAAGEAEVKLGELATEKASNAEVKQFAQQLVEHHQKANTSLERVAAQQNVPVEKELSRRHQKTFDKLSKLSGEEFDREFIKAMVKDHKQAVKKFERQAERAEEPEVQQFASSTLPTLQQHLAEAQRLEQQLEGRQERGTSGVSEPGSSGIDQETGGADEPVDHGDDGDGPGHSEPPPPSPMPDPAQRP